ncbi:patatin-like phospholipase family protein [Mycobacterium sp. KBS0706]|uniref:patatin-like phospholipase family protein n=1 Tax=Mycobacterium sp. KBS0706 TaxID=2578109 RepID=UPI001C8F7EC4|nr:patatin-like phospholipase family protein [Mycobacterium sp. KBS0706]
MPADADQWVLKLQQGGGRVGMDALEERAFAQHAEWRLNLIPSASIARVWSRCRTIRPSQRDLSRLVVLAVALLASGCSPPTRLAAVPERYELNATVGSMQGIRYYPPDHLGTLEADARDSVERERAALAAAGHKGPLPPASYLAVSGGGENGAFGAGLLVGWTKTGTRPEFKVVTGVSTGALTAPFAFLGPTYDDRLAGIYTTITAAEVLEPRGFLAAISDDAMADTAPLRRTIARYVTPDLLAAIAREHEKGRLLLIGTTDLDAQRGVIWNIGKIAASGDPGALELVRSILVASAAIPGAFPPVMIDVMANGQPYQEMHVDGGASAQVFIYPPSLKVAEVAKKAGIVRRRDVYVIRNARLDADWADVKRRTLSIAGRAISSLIQTQGVGDLYRIYAVSQRDGVGFHLAYIPSSFDVKLEAPFDQTYMRALFELGHKLGAQGYPWQTRPPGF